METDDCETDSFATPSDNYIAKLNKRGQSVAGPRNFRPRAETWGGAPSTSAQSNEVGDRLEWKRKLLREKKKFSRKNKWGNCSYKALIIEAIEQSAQQKMTLNEIYEWIVTNIDFFKGSGDTNSSAGWKNSVRHNLSLHPIFVKEAQESQSKSIGCYWKIDKSKEIVKCRKRSNTTDPTQRELAQKRNQERIRNRNLSNTRPKLDFELERLPENMADIGNSPLINASPPIMSADSGHFSPRSSQSSLSDPYEYSPSQKSETNANQAKTTEVDNKNDRVQVCVKVPYHQYELFREKKYTLWLMPKSHLLARQDYNVLEKNIVPNPCPEIVRVGEEDNNSLKLPSQTQPKPIVPNQNFCLEYNDSASNNTDFMNHKLKFGDDFTDFFRAKTQTESDLEQIFDI